LGVGNATLSKIIEKDLRFVYPFLLTASYYVLLAIFWILIKRKIKFPKLSYILITIFDSQANFLNIYAFSVIHFNYPFIINVSSVLWTCILTCIFIRNYRYKKYHIIGVIITMVGVGVSLFSSLRKIQDDSISDNIKGLLFSLGASICYAM
jgi:drug/metabolite transporter (DMT)-like permease